MRSGAERGDGTMAGIVAGWRAPGRIASTTSRNPWTTRPKAVYRPSRCGCAESVTNHWLPAVSFPSDAMPTVPASKGTGLNSSRIA